MKNPYKEAIKRLIGETKKRIPTKRNLESVRLAVKTLSEMPGKLNSISRQIPNKAFDKPLAKGKRTFNQTTAHLLNSEKLVVFGIVQALIIDQPKIHDLHSERDLGPLQLFGSLSTKELLTLFSLKRKSLVHLLESLTDGQWEKRVVEDKKSRRETVYWKVRALVFHELQHIFILKAHLGKL